MNRFQMDFNAIVGLGEYGDLIMLNYIFDDGKGFKGATGASFVPVYQEEIDYNRSTEGFLEQWGDSLPWNLLPPSPE